jgi:hypothetical protein
VIHDARLIELTDPGREMATTVPSRIDDKRLPEE